VEEAGLGAEVRARIVNYADDFVILCRRNAAEARERMEAIMASSADGEPAEDAGVPSAQESFEFLRYALGRCHSSQTGRSYMCPRIANERVKRLCEEISLLTRRTTVGQEAGELVGAINAKLRGWANYFSLGPVSRAYRAVDRHTRYRLRRWLCTKHKVQGPGGQTFPAEHLYERLGLLRLEALTGNLPWAKA
jgi:hypothetical protein